MALLSVVCVVCGGEGRDGKEVAVSCACSLFNLIIVSARFYYITYIFILFAFILLSCVYKRVAGE